MRVDVVYSRVDAMYARVYTCIHMWGKQMGNHGERRRVCVRTGNR